MSTFQRKAHDIFKGKGTQFEKYGSNVNSKGLELKHGIQCKES